MHLQGGGSSQFGRTLIVAGEGAEVTFFESCTSTARPGAALHCAVGEFVLGAHARLNYVALQNWRPNVFNLAILVPCFGLTPCGSKLETENLKLWGRANRILAVGTNAP